MKKIKRISIAISMLVLSMPVSIAVAAFDTNLSYGSRNAAEVKKIQYFLKEQSLFVGPINGNFGPQTRIAVTNFQRRENIRPTSGMWYPLTRARANQLSAQGGPLQAAFAQETTGNRIVNLNVPFVSQAPLGNWSDPKQADGCEEASILMAVAWLRQQGDINPSVAEAEIRAISDYEQAHLGFYKDTGADDTAKLLRDYYGYANLSVEKDISINNILSALENQRLVIVPINGKLIGNPHYLSAPPRHMIIVKGYDYGIKQFILHDPGTSRGKDFKVADSTLQNALQDYPSGNHLPVQVIRTAMITISR
jgi:hypothetical protein